MYPSLKVPSDAARLKFAGARAAFGITVDTKFGKRLKLAPRSPSEPTWSIVDRGAARRHTISQMRFGMRPRLPRQRWSSPRGDHTSGLPMILQASSVGIVVNQ